VSFLAKYLAKAENGYRHGEKFTTQEFAEPIVVQARGSAILQENCVRCHGGLVASMQSAAHPNEFAGVRCVHCHASVGHGQRAGLGGPLRPSELSGIPPKPSRDTHEEPP
jgi:cytochrome c nitrite reductase small subunit